ncbi:hypothetical protein ACO0RG_004347 [Hanseniaspora osmophila]
MSSPTLKPKPKPWEVNPPTSSETIPSVSSPSETNDPGSNGGNNTPSTSSSHVRNPSSKPALPNKPEFSTTDSSSPLNTGYNRNMGYGTGMYGSGMNGSGMYGSGMYGSGMYGSGMYGSGMYGSGMYGSGMYGSGMNGSGINGILPEGTQSAFQLIEAMIYTFTGFAQMLEATYMATHSSFFTMVSVAEQLQNFKEMIHGFVKGGVLDVIRLLKRLLYYASGGKLCKSSGSTGWGNNSFDNHEQKKKKEKKGKEKSKMALKPLVVFLAIAIGFPYLLNKYVTRMSKDNNNNKLNYLDKNNDHQQDMVDPNNLEFAKALYDYVPENPDYEASFTKNEFMAILSKKDALGNDSEWWKVRTRKGVVGYVPSNYIEVIKKSETNA